MKITRQSTIREIQNSFSDVFPYLKLEVYKHEHHELEGSPKGDEVSSDLHVSELNPLFDNCEISLDASLMVRDFENQMLEKAGLNVQVFRKSNNLWLQTSKTDDWTLEKQNGKGYRSALNIYPEADNEYDSD